MQAACNSINKYHLTLDFVINIINIVTESTTKGSNKMTNKTTHYNNYEGNPYIGTNAVEGVIFMLPLNIPEGCYYRYEGVDTSYCRFDNGVYINNNNKDK